MTDDPFQFVPHDQASGICPFKWILMEAERIRRLRQFRNEGIVKTAREMDLAWRRPIWKVLDERLTDREEDRRTTGRRNKR